MLTYHLNSTHLYLANQFDTVVQKREVDSGMFDRWDRGFHHVDSPMA